MGLGCGTPAKFRTQSLESFDMPTAVARYLPKPVSAPHPLRETYLENLVKNHQWVWAMEQSQSLCPLQPPPGWHSTITPPFMGWGNNRC